MKMHGLANVKCIMMHGTVNVKFEKYLFLVPEVKARFLDGLPRRLPAVPTALCQLPFDCTTLKVTSAI